MARQMFPIMCYSICWNKVLITLAVLGAGLPSGLCGKGGKGERGSLLAVTGLTDYMGYLILVTLNKEQE